MHILNRCPKSMLMNKRESNDEMSVEEPSTPRLNSKQTLKLVHLSDPLSLTIIPLRLFVPRRIPSFGSYALVTSAFYWQEAARIYD